MRAKSASSCEVQSAFSVSPWPTLSEAVVLNPAQKPAQTALNRIWWLLRQSFCLFVRADPASSALQFPASRFPSHQLQFTPSPASPVFFFYPSLGQGPMKEVKFFLTKYWV